MNERVYKRALKDTIPVMSGYLVLGKVLPYAIMGMLVVFCLKGISLTEAPHGLPEFMASAAVVLLHIWKRNTLCSIVGGTACYMILIHFVF